MKKIFILLFLMGCGSHSGPGVSTPVTPPTTTSATTTSTSTLYWLPGTSPPPTPSTNTPVIFDTWPVDRLDSIQELWIPAGTVGLPPGWLIITHEGNGFWSIYHNKIVYGLTHFDTKIIEISKNAPHTTREWPALGHELAHAWVFVLSGNSELAYIAGH